MASQSFDLGVATMRTKGIAIYTSLVVFPSKSSEKQIQATKQSCGFDERSHRGSTRDGPAATDCHTTIFDV
jgi:hypothetical protein